MRKPRFPSSAPIKHLEDEERKGLLASEDNVDHLDDVQDLEPQPWSKKKLILVASIFIALLVSGSFARYWLLPPPPRHGGSTGDLFSNGTHEFKRTVLIVSIDGLRADYLDRGLTPHLLDISKRGLRAKSMVPIFPTLTFPNHWALMTGLHAESHGIVANNFWDPVTDTEFHYNRIESCWIPSWWYGEPMWETAEKAGVITANLMWPGPPQTTAGTGSTYFVPWKDKTPLGVKLDQIMDWIDLPLQERPQLIMAYEPSLDQAGHLTGPMSALVNKTLVEVDVFARDLHTELELRNLTDIVDIVFVSDHGMTDTSHPDLIYMDDILGDQAMSEIEHIDGWPSWGIRFSSPTNVSRHLAVLNKAAEENPEKFSVYTKESMPERYHFSKNERIAPLYVIPNIGYVLTTRKEGDTGMSKGNHGYDNQEPSMHAMFVAHGPFAAVAKAQHQQRSSGLLARALGIPPKGWYSTSDDAFIMDSFANVEIYNLVMILLGLEATAAPTNGTLGFWDMYL
ncbi:Phosphodiest-domain-containing protein [Pluteus cervinus]|uniref:Phosphodiest-domain-containing protein n=1 Tax=Pluteus cervinus TaxID=181527 RepID=A0ACD3B762_9AGAR|nr:Phosphodiest-domain-containing protein [Pluteus cervinus]